MPAEAPQLLSVLLRTTTRDAHTRAEQSLAIMAPTLSLEQYAHFLCCWEGFHATWEPIASAMLPHDYWQGRSKLEALRQDLQRLDQTDPVESIKSIDRDVLGITDYPDAIGTLYVTEGATLGGQHIARHVERVLGITPTTGGRFLHIYGDRIADRWRQTTHLIDTAAVDREQVVRAANRAFDVIAAWLAR